MNSQIPFEKHPSTHPIRAEHDNTIADSNHTGITIHTSHLVSCKAVYPNIS